MWQTSDKVDPKIIKDVVIFSKCIRDCVFSARIGMRECGGHSEYYDKEGILHINDNNKMDVNVDCACGRKFFNNCNYIEELTGKFK